MPRGQFIVFLRLLRQFYTDESGQGMTEYVAILAFIACFVALTFTLQGPLSRGLSNAFSSCSNQLNSLAAVS
jgi:Flp pilus assembly pilin Flp